VLGILLWVVFGYYWHLVFQRPISQHTRFALVGVSAIVVVITLFLVYWVFHNRRIARRNQRRTRRVASVAGPDVDFLGRAIVSPRAGELARAPYVEVGVLDMDDGEGEVTGHKVFRIGDVP
jgi:hypothetical protein